MIPELPQLPKHDYSWIGQGKETPLFTADQMRSYGAACAAWATERAARMCEERANGWDEDPPYGLEGVYDYRWEEATNCAAAIRAGGKE